MFTVEERERVRARIVELARNDRRVTGGAMTGSMPAGDAERWSDIDLVLAVADGGELAAVVMG